MVDLAGLPSNFQLSTLRPLQLSHSLTIVFLYMKLPLQNQQVLAFLRSFAQMNKKRQRIAGEVNEESKGICFVEDDDSGDPETRKKDLQSVINSLILLEGQESALDFFSNLEIDETSGVERRRSRKLGPASTASRKESPVSCHGAANGSGQNRRLWVKDRSKAWWDECSRPDYPDDEFKKAFRMGKSTFEMICEELNSVIAKEDTTLRNAIPVKQRVAVCVWRLATGEPLRLVSKRFGLGISTCHKLVLEVCSAIRIVLMPKFLQWPDEDSLKKTKGEFESVSGIPNVVGSMYTTHIPIIAPKASIAAYLNKRHTERNQRTSYSITVQGVVDHRRVFTDVCIGWPGSMNDDQVLEKSALYQRANGGLLKGFWIVGSSGYPLMDWVLVPYLQQHLTWAQHAFNEKIEEVQRVAKEAFGRLKGRWRCLQKRTEVKLKDLPVVLGACCVLHNICEMRNEEMDPELRVEFLDDEMVPEVASRSVSSIKARDAIAHDLLHHGLAGSPFH